MSDLTNRLRYVADLIENEPDRWCQGYMARDKNLKPVDEQLAYTAHSRCAIGWANWVSSHECRRPLDASINISRAMLVVLDGDSYVGAWNDNPKRSPRDIVNLFRKSADIIDSLG